uniref:Non-specific serine/threonine protein kinase n=1 Tax=Parastrongyloides trichosuri TaxID=131310 RepID=A0A0N4ZNF6_PARTI
MPSKAFAKLFTSCYAGNDLSRGRKKHRKEIPEFMDDYSLNLSSKTCELTDTFNGQPIYAVPYKKRDSLSSDYHINTLPRHDSSYTNYSSDTTRLSCYNDIFINDIIPGSSDENSRRILRKLTESKQKTPVLCRKDIPDRNQLLINETNGYAQIIKTPKSKKKSTLPQSPVLDFTKKNSLPRTITKSREILPHENNKEDWKDVSGIMENNCNIVEDICNSMVGFCELPRAVNKMSSSVYKIPSNKNQIKDKIMSSSYNDEGTHWRTAAFSGCNHKPLVALINPKSRPTFTVESNINKSKEKPIQLCNVTSPSEELFSQEYQNERSKDVNVSECKTLSKNSSYSSLSLDEKQLQLSISKSDEYISRPSIKLNNQTNNDEKNCLPATCCSPVTRRRGKNISRGSPSSSEYHIKTNNIINETGQNQLVSKINNTTIPSCNIEKRCGDYSSLSSSTSSINNKNVVNMTKVVENNNIDEKQLMKKTFNSMINTLPFHLKNKKSHSLNVIVGENKEDQSKEGTNSNCNNESKKRLILRKRTISSNENNNTTKTDMSMIATVYPFQRSSNNCDDDDDRENDGKIEKDNYNDGNHFKIEDVTDDPNYQDGDNKEDEDNYEGSMVEYCRLDSNNSNDKFNPRNSIFEAVSCRQKSSDKDINNLISSLKDSKDFDKEKNYRYSFIQPVYDSNGNIFEEVGKTRQFSKQTMANILDIGVGEPCINEKNCKCHGFAPHKWRKVCVHCKCDRNDHEIGGNKYLTVYERLGITPSAEMADVMRSVRNDAPGQVGHGYSWVPPGLSRVKVEEYMSQLPNHLVPRTNSAGEKHRERQLIMQLPRQDLSSAYCKHLKTPVERKVYEEFVNARNEVALDIGYVDAKLTKSSVCSKCNGIMEKGDLAVIAPKLGDHNTWHPACFTCKTCDQLLIDLTYCVRENAIYCERHYAELHKPRCSACDELIFAGEYTKAMNKDWHSDHFCCWQCDTALTGLRYVLRDEHPFCIKCYEDVFANQCDECGKPIGIDSKDLSYKDTHWHPDCFKCKICKISLVDKPFGSKNDSIFCSNCYDNAFATRCDGCNEIFRAGMKKMEYKGKKWHEKCFCCLECKVPIGTKSFIPKNEEVYCATCYEDKFATKCKSCKKVITTGGVTYKNDPYHRECFCCQNCHASLAGQRFTSKEDKPYCANCYGELFAKRCVSCTKPITGIGGSKFISFEDRNYHNDCFICNQCSISLVGKGFITDGADILCPECAKARLMAQHS